MLVRKKVSLTARRVNILTLNNFSGQMEGEKEKGKQCPLRKSGHWNKRVFSAKLAATPCVTGSTAAAATTNGVSGGDAETGTRAGFNVFKLDCPACLQQTFFNQEFQAVIIVNFISFFWLVQSQSQ